MKEEILFASSICGGCKPSIALVQQAKYAPHVRIAYVNALTSEPGEIVRAKAVYDEMVAARVHNTPTLLTKTKQRIEGGGNIAAYLESTYG